MIFFQKIGLKKSSGFGSAYTEKEAVSKAREDCKAGLSAVTSIYDKTKFKDSFKGWKITKCVLEIENQKVLSSRPEIAL